MKEFLKNNKFNEYSDEIPANRRISGGNTGKNNSIHLVKIRRISTEKCAGKFRQKR
jgi:hypothetical protein